MSKTDVFFGIDRTVAPPTDMRHPNREEMMEAMSQPWQPDPPRFLVVSPAEFARLVAAGLVGKGGGRKRKRERGAR